jgi:hypothetical protein
MDGNRALVSKTFYLYGWVFALAGVGFVVLTGLVTWGLNLAAVLLPGGAEVPAGPVTLWLGLTGSLMAVLTLLAFSLARDPEQDLGWTTIIVSKFVSSSLFALFALTQRNTGFLLAAAVDGAIGLHLVWLRGHWARARHYGFAPRFPLRSAPFYEVWFAKANDPKTRGAVWVRYTLEKGARGDVAACWYVLFDAVNKKTHHGKWERPLAELSWGEDSPFRLDLSLIEPGRLLGATEGVSWELRWTRTPSPAFSFVPPILSGLLPSGYAAPVSAAKFSGAIKAGGATLELKDAPGSIGHLWGPRMAESWRWAHAIFDDGSVFEILTARVKIGPFRSPELTTAHLWRGGRHYESVALTAALRNESRRDGERWSFRVFFDGLTVSGECAPALSIDLPYSSPDGRTLVCRNSKTGAMKLSGEGWTLETKDQAAVEFAQ